MTDTLTIAPGDLALPDLRRILRDPPVLTLAPGCRAAIDASARTVAEAAGGERAVYGVNTGFGLLAKKRIPPIRCGSFSGGWSCRTAPAPGRTCRRAWCG